MNLILERGIRHIRLEQTLASGGVGPASARETIAMTWPREEHVDSVEDLVSELDKLIQEAQSANQRWIYRGQSRAAWGLEPTIERRVPKNSARVSESQLLWDFKRMATPLSDRAPHFDDTPSWLALMRHHGAPTRILDWTDSPYVALFFACDEGERQDDDKDQKSSVWVLNATLIRDETEKQIARIVPKRAEWKTLDLSCQEHFDQVALYAFDDRTGGNPNKDEGLIAELPPRWANARMAFQQGTFLINCNHTLGFMQSLEIMMTGPSPSSDSWVRKLVFPWTLREKIWNFLYDRNIHPFTLFPDLDGLARLLKLKNHVFESTPKPRV